MINKILYRLNIFRAVNPYMFLRALRMAFAIVFPLFVSHVFPISKLQIIAFFCGTLLLSISDVFFHFETRVKNLTFVAVIISFIAFCMSLIPNFLLYNIAVILIVVLLFSYLRFRIIDGNNIFLVALLMCCFATPMDLSFKDSSLLLIYMILACCWYIGLVMISYSVYTYFQRQNNKIAKLFYMPGDEERYKLKFFKSHIAALRSLNKEYKKDRTYIFRHPFRLFLSLVLGLYLMSLIDTDKSLWIIITIVIVHHPSKKVSDSLSKIIERFFGTLIGLAIIYFYVENTSHGLWDLILMQLFATIIFLTVTRDYLMAVVFITCLVILVIDYTGLYSEMYIYERLADTIIGIAIVLFVQFFLKTIESIFFKEHHIINP